VVNPAPRSLPPLSPVTLSPLCHQNIAIVHLLVLPLASKACEHAGANSCSPCYLNITLYYLSRILNNSWIDFSVSGLGWGPHCRIFFSFDFYLCIHRTRLRILQHVTPPRQLNELLRAGPGLIPSSIRAQEHVVQPSGHMGAISERERCRSI